MNDDTSFYGREIIKQIRDTVYIPFVAIGGINSENILQLYGLGINGAAVASAIWHKRILNPLQEKCGERWKGYNVNSKGRIFRISRSASGDGVPFCFQKLRCIKQRNS